MKKPGNILIVDDNRGVLTAVQLLLKPHFEKIITLPSPVTLTSVLREENPSVVLLDMNFTSGINTGNEGLFWLQEIKRLRPSLPVVLFTAYGDIDLAVRGIKEGQRLCDRDSYVTAEKVRNAFLGMGGSRGIPENRRSYVP